MKEPPEIFTILSESLSINWVRFRPAATTNIVTITMLLVLLKPARASLPLMHPVNTRTIRVASAVMPIGNLFHAKQSMESTNTMIQMVSVLIIASNFFRSEQRPLLAPAGELVAAKRILWHYFTVSSCLCLSAFLGLSKNKQSFHHAVFAEPLTEKSHKITHRNLCLGRKNKNYATK